MVIQFCHSKLYSRQKGGDCLTKNIVNEFKQLFPEYADKRLSVDGKGNIVTAGGRVLGVRDGSKGWVIKPLGGRPTSEPKSHDIRVRVSQRQFDKLSDYADSKGINKPQAIRNLIDEL